MKCKEILENLNKIMPMELAMSWDNPGLLVGRRDCPVKRILLALDVTTEAIEQAVALGVDLLITHHPLIFSPLKKINDEDIFGSRILSLVENRINYIAMHTNYDVAIGCMGDLAAEKIEIQGRPLEVTGQIDGVEIGVGKVGKLKNVCTLEALIAHVKAKFSLPFVSVYGAELLENKRVETVAISPGSGKGMYSYAVAAGAQVLITGDITHHEALDAREAGICIIDAGHYGLEHIFMEDMEKKIKKFMPRVAVYRVPFAIPVQVR